MSQRERILEAIRESSDGLTCEELEERLGIIHRSVTPRVGELTNAGLIKNSGLKRPTKSGSTAAVFVVCAEGEIVPIVKSDKPKPQVKISASPQAFWSDIRRRLHAHVARQTNTIDAGQLQKAYREFEVDLRDCVDRFVKKVSQMKAPKQEPVSRRKLRDACHTLQVDLPAIGAVVDGANAKRNYRRIVRLYHPDVSRQGDKEASRAMYEAAVDAYETIEQYNSTLLSKEKTNDEPRQET